MARTPVAQTILLFACLVPAASSTVTCPDLKVGSSIICAAEADAGHVCNPSLSGYNCDQTICTLQSDKTSLAWEPVSPCVLITPAPTSGTPTTAPTYTCKSIQYGDLIACPGSLAGQKCTPTVDGYFCQETTCEDTLQWSLPQPCSLTRTPTGTPTTPAPIGPTGTPSMAPSTAPSYNCDAIKYGELKACNASIAGGSCKPDLSQYGYHCDPIYCVGSAGAAGGYAWTDKEPCFKTVAPTGSPTTPAPTTSVPTTATPTTGTPTKAPTHNCAAIIYDPQAKDPLTVCAGSDVGVTCTPDLRAAGYDCATSFCGWNSAHTVVQWDNLNPCTLTVAPTHAPTIVGATSPPSNVPSSSPTVAPSFACDSIQYGSHQACAATSLGHTCDPDLSAYGYECVATFCSTGTGTGVTNWSHPDPCFLTGGPTPAPTTVAPITSVPTGSPTAAPTKECPQIIYGSPPQTACEASDHGVTCIPPNIVGFTCTTLYCTVTAEAGKTYTWSNNGVACVATRAPSQSPTAGPTTPAPTPTGPTKTPSIAPTASPSTAPTYACPAISYINGKLTACNSADCLVACHPSAAGGKCVPQMMSGYVCQATLCIGPGQDTNSGYDWTIADPCALSVAPSTAPVTAVPTGTPTGGPSVAPTAAPTHDCAELIYDTVNKYSACPGADLGTLCEPNLAAHGYNCENTICTRSVSGGPSNWRPPNPCFLTLAPSAGPSGTPSGTPTGTPTNQAPTTAPTNECPAISVMKPPELKVAMQVCAGMDRGSTCSPVSGNDAGTANIMGYSCVDATCQSQCAGTEPWCWKPSAPCTLTSAPTNTPTTFGPTPTAPTNPPTGSPSNSPSSAPSQAPTFACPEIAYAPSGSATPQVKSFVACNQAMPGYTCAAQLNATAGYTCVETVCVYKSAGASSATNYEWSVAEPCSVTTAPTGSPTTFVPTNSPSGSPTTGPTPAPTFACDAQTSADTKTVFCPASAIGSVCNPTFAAYACEKAYCTFDGTGAGLAHWQTQSGSKEVCVLTVAPTAAPLTSGPTGSPSNSPSFSPTAAPTMACRNLEYSGVTFCPTEPGATGAQPGYQCNPDKSAIGWSCGETICACMQPDCTPCARANEWCHLYDIGFIYNWTDSAPCFLTQSPTIGPSNSPSMSPTMSPTNSPSNSPSMSPTASPSLSPTSAPSNTPTWAPSLAPTFETSYILAMEINFGNISGNEAVKFGQTYSDSPSIIDTAIRQAIGTILTLDPSVINVDRDVGVVTADRRNSNCVTCTSYDGTTDHAASQFCQDNEGKCWDKNDCTGIGSLCDVSPSVANDCVTCTSYDYNADQSSQDFCQDSNGKCFSSDDCTGVGSYCHVVTQSGTTMVVTVGAASASYVSTVTDKLRSGTMDGQLTKLVDKAITTLSRPGNPAGLGHSVGSTTLLTSHALPNAYEATEEEQEKSNQKSISMWFMVCFGVAGCVVVIGAVHVYLMFKYGWDKSGIEAEEEWDEWYDEEAYEEEYEEEETAALAYVPPTPSYGDDEEGQILAAAEVAGINMNDSQALIAFTKEWKATNT